MSIDYNGNGMMNMPLLERCIEPQTKNDDVVVLHINHCMDNSFYFSSVLARVFHKVVFIALPYNNRDIKASSEYATYHAYSANDGFHLMCDNKEITCEKENYVGATKKLISLAIEKSLMPYVAAGKKILIVEDGGYHYEVVCELLQKYPSLAESVIGAVEQTTSGTKQSTQQKRHLYPVASVSRSIYKVRIESYFVAQRVIGYLDTFLRELGFFVDFHKVLILGYGIIGRSISKCLSSRNVSIRIRDIDPLIEETAVKEGFSLWKGAFTNNMIVLGNSGKRSFTKQMLSEFLESTATTVILASSSSKQTEFEDIFDVLAEVESEKEGASVIYTFPNGKKVVLLAKGYPLNFADEVQDSLTYDMIDPVFTEIYLLMLFLIEREDRLEKRTYLLGNDEAVDREIDEKALISLWLEINHLHMDVDTFNKHPNEARLTLHALQDNSTGKDGSDKK